MTESKAPSGGLAAGIAHAAAAFAQTPFPYLVGLGLMWAGAHWDGHIVNQAGCVKLEDAHGVTYAVNSCTGKVEPVVATASAASAATHP